MLDFFVHVDDERIVLVAEVDGRAGNTEAGDERGRPSLDAQLHLAQQRVGKGGEHLDPLYFSARL